MSPSSSPSVEEVAKNLLAKSNGGFGLISVKTLQSLWAGYGHICQVRAEQNCQPISFILKHINPPKTKVNGHLPNEGHIRKILSYRVERYFYTELAPRMPEGIAVAECLASAGEGDGTALLLSDLRNSHPVDGGKRAELSEQQTHAALEWLASFHGFWWSKVEVLDKEKMVLPPLQHFEKHKMTELKDGGVWLNGGYTYLETRMSEYESLRADDDSEWSVFANGTPSIAERVAFQLSPKDTSKDEYRTLIHGDVKSENLFTTEDGSSVAFFDFQYVGLGLGVCDLAKLFTCSVPGHLLPVTKDMTSGEAHLLQIYHRKLEQSSGKTYPWDVFVEHWETALLDWLRFQASWGFWGNTEWLEERGRCILDKRGWSPKATMTKFDHEECWRHDRA